MFEKLRLVTAICASKALALIISLFGGGATAAPGLVALKIDPNLISKLSRKIPKGAIIVTGTNGKTTTSRIISDILSSKFKIIHNRQGSNLLRGIASTLTQNASLFGKMKSDIAIWEIDEATFPQALEQTNAKTVVFLNLFRDQLDRYGEVDSLREKWQKAIVKLDRKKTLILNADDPAISYLSNHFRGKVVYFGVNDKKINIPQISHVQDINHCLVCGNKLYYQSVFSSHLGLYKCPKCHFKRPNPQVAASQIKINNDFISTFNLKFKNKILKLKFQHPGLYNIYNVLAAVSTIKLFGIKKKIIMEKIKQFSSAFGRSQQVKVYGKNALVYLIKNPTGANEVIRTIFLGDNLNLLVILNDNIADGRDVSWIWDTNWEILQEKIKSISVSGIRAWDMALRLKYAGFKLSNKNINENINYATQLTLNNLSNNDTLIILPTYTALLEIQKILAKKGEQKWQHQ